MIWAQTTFSTSSFAALYVFTQCAELITMNYSRISRMFHVLSCLCAIVKFAWQTSAHSSGLIVSSFMKPSQNSLNIHSFLFDPIPLGKYLHYWRYFITPVGRKLFISVSVSSLIQSSLRAGAMLHSCLCGCA